MLYDISTYSVRCLWHFIESSTVNILAMFTLCEVLNEFFGDYNRHALTTTWPKWKYSLQRNVMRHEVFCCLWSFVIFWCTADYLVDRLPATMWAGLKPSRKYAQLYELISRKIYDKAGLVCKTGHLLID